MNMCWGGHRGSFDYDDWLPALAKAGGNWVRIWMNDWNCALEWSPGPPDDWHHNVYQGVGVYSLANAWKLDEILGAAERNGINVMLCLGTYGEFTTGGYFNEGLWKGNPYNAVNGGPCNKPEDFWTDPAARKLYQRRLRYLAARYGYHTNLQAWEFWNETKAPAEWVGAMARYLKGAGEFKGQPADPYGHLITTTYGNEDVWKLPEVDFTQSHHYGQGNVADHAPVIHQDARQAATYGKPHLMGEFGIDWRDTDRKYDPAGLGINLHNGIWSSIASGNAGTAMIWWWDNYIHPGNLYHEFTPLRAFTDTIPWMEGKWTPLACDAPVSTGQPETWTDLVLPATAQYGVTTGREFTITPTGVAGDVELPGYIYSPSKANLRITPVFHVKYEHAGRFILHVDTVSSRVKIRFLLDGNPVGEVALSATPPTDPTVKPEYESTAFQKEWSIYQARYNKDYGIDVPIGEHAITVDNLDGDWFTLSNITLAGYRGSKYPSMNLYGQMNGRMAILWAQNALHNWKNVAEKREILAIKGASTTVHGLPPGAYRIEWWDTEKGGVLTQQTAHCTGGALPVTMPDIATDVAARIVPVINNK